MSPAEAQQLMTAMGGGDLMDDEGVHDAVMEEAYWNGRREL